MTSSNALAPSGFVAIRKKDGVLVGAGWDREDAFVEAGSENCRIEPATADLVELALDSLGDDGYVCYSNVGPVYCTVIEYCYAH